MTALYRVIKPLLFQLPPESSHDVVINSLAKANNHPRLLSLIKNQLGKAMPLLPIELMGIKFPNPVGLAAGLDKQGNCGNVFSAMGFGWVEMGTVTPEAQVGNDKPRMFRLVEHQAIINRMGFNSCGLQQFLKNIVTTHPHVIKGINIGKNARTPIARAADDYLACMDAVYVHADYITVNISSPNTQNLRALQNDDALDSLLAAIVAKRQELTDQSGKRVPLVLKIAPDLDQDQIVMISRLVQTHEIDAVAATNTTIDKTAVTEHPNGNETGGLSGAPVRGQATWVIAALANAVQGSVPIIGMGGIDSPIAAIEKLKAGASLLQLYTGFIYNGPKLIQDIALALEKECNELTFAQWLDLQHRQN